MKRWKIVTLVLIIVAGIGFATVTYYVKSTSAWIKTVAWEDPALTTVPDGEYLGISRLFMPAGTAAANTTASVLVRIRDHRYSAITVTEPAAIARRMTRYAQLVIETQSVKPEVISGATVTKVVTLMAISNAVAGQ